MLAESYTPQPKRMQRSSYSKIAQALSWDIELCATKLNSLLAAQAFYSLRSQSIRALQRHPLEKPAYTLPWQ